MKVLENEHRSCMACHGGTVRHSPKSVWLIASSFILDKINSVSPKHAHHTSISIFRLIHFDPLFELLLLHPIPVPLLFLIEVLIFVFIVIFQRVSRLLSLLRRLCEVNVLASCAPAKDIRCVDLFHVVIVGFFYWEIARLLLVVCFAVQYLSVAGAGL